MLLNSLFFPTLFKGQPKGSLHNFSAKSLAGETVNFSQFKGKKLLIVNTASECGLTPQYKDLEKLYEEYRAQGLVVIGFPCNDFGAQEPGSNTEIKSFCERNYGVTFLMMDKISVKGEAAHPIYKYLCSKNENGVKNSVVKWNFQKYLVDEQGQLHDVVGPWKSPHHRKILQWLLH